MSRTGLERAQGIVSAGEIRRRASGAGGEMGRASEFIAERVEPLGEGPHVCLYSVHDLVEHGERVGGVTSRTAASAFGRSAGAVESNSVSQAACASARLFMRATVSQPCPAAARRKCPPGVQANRRSYRTPRRPLAVKRTIAENHHRTPLGGAELTARRIACGGATPRLLQR